MDEKKRFRNGEPCENCGRIGAEIEQIDFKLREKYINGLAKRWIAKGCNIVEDFDLGNKIISQEKQIIDQERKEAKNELAEKIILKIHQYKFLDEFENLESEIKEMIKEI